MSIPVRYNTNGSSIELKPNTVTFVADTLVTAKELKDCYGDRIIILSQEIVDEIIKEDAPVEVKEPEIANTGDKEVDDFLNGETDKLPEGTTEITEEEALKLQRQTEAEARAKEEAEKLEALKIKEAQERAKAKTEADKKAKEAEAKKTAKSTKTTTKAKNTKGNKNK